MSEQRSLVALTFRRLLRRLAQFRPFSNQSQLEQASGEFVLAAIYENGGSTSSREECQDLVQDLWGLSSDLEEISAVIDRLLRTDKLVDEHECLRLSDRSMSLLGERVRMSKEVETTALAEFEQEVRRKNVSLGDAQVEQMREDLVTWVQQIVADYGVEAATLLAPDHRRYTRCLREAAALCDAVLPEREPAVAAARTDALLMIFEKPTQTKMQRAYFENLLATWFLLSIYTLDPAALGAVQRLTNGQRLYLDTNVVYSLLRLNGPERYLFVERVLRRSARLGYQICVTSWTVTEMQESVWTARERLARERPSPHALADLDFESNEEFRKGYRKLERESGVNLDDYNALPRHIELLLEREGVVVMDDGCPEIDAAPDRFDEQISELERHRTGREKPRALQEHDVKHLSLMRLRRGGRRRRFSDVRSVLLSNDRVLCRCADAIREHPGEPPYAVSLTRWAHVTRSLIPRTSDYDKTLAQIHKTPAVRPSGLINQGEIAAAQERINEHHARPEGAALETMLNTALGGTPEPDNDYYGRPDGGGADPRQDETGSTGIVELEDQVHERDRKLADERYQREIERDKHVRHEEALREELGIQRRGRIEAEEKSERLQKRVNELRKKPGPVRGERSGAGDLRQRVNQLEEEARRREVKRRHRTMVERRLAGSLAALAGLVVGIVPWASGLVGGDLPVAVDACCGVLLLVGGAVLIWGSGALGVCCALIGACTGTAATVFAAKRSEQHGTQTTVVSQPVAGRPPHGKTLKPHQQSPRRSKRPTRQTRSKH
jgi:predicted nucleic acid-binding protein